MKNILKLFWILLFVILTNKSFAVECKSECQLEQVKLYFAALDKVARKGSTSNDIDALLELTHENVKYIHVEYEANFDKKTWRNAFLRNLELGRYQNTEENEKRILRSISGKNYLAVEYSRGIVHSDGSWSGSEPLLALFGFTDGKISLIKELW